MFIPKQLQDSAFRFIRTRGKIAIEKKWSTENNYIYKDEKFEKWIENDNNYGVVGGFGNIVIIDFDDIEFYKKFKTGIFKYMCDSFSVETNKGVHVYVKFPKVLVPKKMKILAQVDNELQEVGDLQAIGGYVIGPGSIHPSGKQYTVINNEPIIELSTEQTEEFLRSIDLGNNNKGISRVKFKDKQGKEKAVLIKDRSLITQEIIAKKTISSLLEEAGIKNILDNPCMCPLGHESESQRCFAFDDKQGIWHCFHCNESGNTIELKKQLMQLEEKLQVDKRKKSTVITYNKAKQELIRELGIDVQVLIENQKEKFMENTERVREAFKAYIGTMNNHKASEIISDFVKDKYYFFFIEDDNKPECWFYNEQNGLYEKNGITKIQKIIRQIIGEYYEKNIVSEIIKKLRADRDIDIDELFTEPPINLILLKNGIFDIYKKELMDFSPKIRFFSRLNVNYDPDATCPNFIKFLNQVLSDREDDVAIIQEFAGTLLERRIKTKKSILCSGHGDNGKSVLLTHLKNFVGVENYKAIRPQQLATDQYIASELQFKLLNVNADIPPTKFEETDTLKMLMSGEDSISANRKYKLSINFTNYAKFIFAANQVPATVDKSDGFFTRWIIIEFNNKYVSKDNLYKYKDYNKGTVSLKDPELVNKLNDETEMSGFLNWALEGLERLKKNDYSMTLNTATKNIEKWWNMKSSTAVEFITYNVEKDKHQMISQGEFMEKYSDYCYEHNLVPETLKSVSYHLQQTFGTIEKRIVDPNGNGMERIRVFPNIKWKDKNTKLL